MASFYYWRFWYRKHVYSPNIGAASARRPHSNRVATQAIQVRAGKVADLLKDMATGRRLLVLCTLAGGGIEGHVEHVKEPGASGR